MTPQIKLAISKGETFSKKVIFGCSPVQFLKVTGLDSSPPAKLTVPGHGLPDGWFAALVSAPWATGLRATQDPPLKTEYRPILCPDADHVVFDGVNSAGWTFSPGAYLRTYSKYPFAGKTADLYVRQRGTELLHLSTGGGGLSLEDGFLTIEIPADTTSAFSWTSGQVELTLTDGDVVSLLAQGAATVEA